MATNLLAKSETPQVPATVSSSIEPQDSSPHASTQTSNASLPTANPSIPRDLQEFHLFPNLAPELRLKIWGQDACVRRVIEIGVEASNEFDGQYMLKTRVPSILHACQEGSSRRGFEVLRAY